jgi:hypothetical protein
MTHSVFATEDNGMDAYEAMEKAAYQGDYQAQRNLSYTLSTGMPRNLILGCAWRIVIIGSGSPQVDQSDTGNKTHYCDRTLNSDELLAARKQAEKIQSEIKRNRSKATE